MAADSDDATAECAYRTVGRSKAPPGRLVSKLYVVLGVVAVALVMCGLPSTVVRAADTDPPAAQGAGLWTDPARAISEAAFGVPTEAGMGAPTQSRTGTSNESGTVVPTPAMVDVPSDTADWTPDQAESAIRADSIARLPGAPAYLNTQAVAQAIAGTSTRVILLPFAPLDPDSRRGVGTRTSELRSWASSEGIELIAVSGLQVSFSIFLVAPNSVAEMEPVLSQLDVTHQVLSAIAKSAKRPEIPDTPARPQVPADQDQVAAVGAALTTAGIYNDPGLAEPQRIDSAWSARFGSSVRVAFLPPGAPGTPLTDLLTPLHRRFPGDVVILVRGRWLEIAGPDDNVLQSARLWTYGYGQRPALGWDVQPTALINVLANRVDLLRTGVVTDRAAPDPPTDPVSSAGRWTPWLFAGAAFALAALVAVRAALARRRSAVERELADRATTLQRRTLGARLATVAGQIVDLDGLDPHEAGRKLSSAAERYEVARQVLADDGDVAVADAALTAAEADVRTAAGVLHVVLPVGTGLL